MFTFNGTECRVSVSLYTRLGEACNDTVTNVVYMIQEPAGELNHVAFANNLFGTSFNVN